MLACNRKQAVIGQGCDRIQATIRTSAIRKGYDPSGLRSERAAIRMGCDLNGLRLEWLHFERAPNMNCNQIGLQSCGRTQAAIRNGLRSERLRSATGCDQDGLRSETGRDQNGLRSERAAL